MEEGITLVLGGGFASNGYHAGVLAACEEAHVKIGRIVASSMAGIAATLYASGNRPEEIVRCISSIKRSDVFGVTEFLKSLRHCTNGKKLMGKIRPYLHQHRLEQMNVPLTLVSYNFSDHIEHAFEAGNVLIALNATIASPLFFEEVKRKGKILGDVRFLSLLPVNHADKNTIIVGVKVQQPYKPYNRLSYWNIIKTNYLIHTNHLHDLKLKRDAPHIMIEPDITAYYDWRFDKKFHLQAFERGLIAGRKRLKALRMTEADA